MKRRQLNIGYPGLLFLTALGGLACDRDPPIVRALPPAARNVHVERTSPGGLNLEGDATLTISADMDDDACASFLRAYAPKEGLRQIGSAASWTKSDPGREMVTASCSSNRLEYEYLKM